MFDFLTPLLNVIDEFAKHSNITLSREPVERIRQDQLDINAEIAKGDGADMQVLADLYDKLEIDTKAYEQEALTVIASASK